MSVRLPSTQVQQNFGMAMDRALIEQDVVVERYGQPRVVIVEYGRYQRLLDAERELTAERLRRISEAAAARAAALSDAEITDLIEQVRGEVAAEGARA